jgi:hypothetical protein
VPPRPGDGSTIFGSATVPPSPRLQNAKHLANGTSVCWRPSLSCRPASLPQSPMAQRRLILRSPASPKPCPIHGPNRSGVLGSICRAGEYSCGATGSSLPKSLFYLSMLLTHVPCVPRKQGSGGAKMVEGQRCVSLRESVLDNEPAAAVDPTSASRLSYPTGFLKPVSGNSRTGLPFPKTEIGKKRAETGARNPRP